MAKQTAELNRHAIWGRYAVTYLLIILIPFTVMSVFFNRYIDDEVQRERETATQETLQGIQAAFDEKLLQIASIGAQSSAVRDFHRNQLRVFSMETRQSIRQSLLYSAAISLFFDDIVYYNDVLPDVLFTIDGTYVTRNYRQIWNEARSEWQLLNEFFAGSPEPGWIPSRYVNGGSVNAGDALLYCQPMEKVGNGYLLFTIREDSIRRLFSLGSDEVYILDGETLLYPFHGQIPDAADGDMLEDGRCLYRRTSEMSGLSYLYLTRPSAIPSRAGSAMTVFMLLNIAVSVVCMVLVVLVSGRHARPLEQLVSLSAGIVPDDLYGVARVQSAMNQLCSRSQQLDELRQASMRGHALIRLIRGKYASEQDAEANLSRLGIVFARPQRVIMLLHREQNWEDNGLIGRVTNLLSRTHDVYGFAYAERSVFVFLLDLPSPDRAGLVTELEELAALPEFSAARLHFAVGGCFTGLIGMQQSYLQALSAGYSQTDALVSLFEQETEDEAFYPYEELRALTAALANQDRNRTAFLYDMLMKLAAKNSHSYFYTVSLLSEMIRLYQQALSPQGGVPAGSMDLPGEPISDVDDLYTCLRSLHQRVVQAMTESGLTGTADMSDIANYISACQQLDTLNVSLVADTFGMNVSSLSHKFKDQMGCNLSDYILTCKMKRACTMLRATDDTIISIGQKLGYSQYTSFVRTFKRLMGTTPSAYRETWRSGGEEDAGPENDSASPQKDERKR